MIHEDVNVLGSQTTLLLFLPLFYIHTHKEFNVSVVDFVKIALN